MQINTHWMFLTKEQMNFASSVKSCDHFCHTITLTLHLVSINPRRKMMKHKSPAHRGCRRWAPAARISRLQALKWRFMELVEAMCVSTDWLQSRSVSRRYKAFHIHKIVVHIKRTQKNVQQLITLTLYAKQHDASKQRRKPRNVIRASLGQQVKGRAIRLITTELPWHSLM